MLAHMAALTPSAFHPTLSRGRLGHNADNHVRYPNAMCPFERLQVCEGACWMYLYRSTGDLVGNWSGTPGHLVVMALKNRWAIAVPTPSLLSLPSPPSPSSLFPTPPLSGFFTTSMTFSRYGLVGRVCSLYVQQRAVYHTAYKLSNRSHAMHEEQQRGNYDATFVCRPSKAHAASLFARPPLPRSTGGLCAAYGTACPLCRHVSRPVDRLRRPVRLGRLAALHRSGSGSPLLRGICGRSKRCKCRLMPLVHPW